MSYYSWRRHDLALLELKELREMRARQRRQLRLKRGRPWKPDLYRAMVKKLQFSMACHRQGLKCVFDDEYPRMNQLSAYARPLYEHLVEPAIVAWREAGRRW